MMKRLLLALDGSFVLGLGLYMLFLSQAEAYSAFMNPGFRPITGAAGAGLCIIGAAFLVHPHGQTDLLRALCFAVLGMLVLQAGNGSVESAGSFAVSPPPQTRIDPAPHLVRNGDTFLKTNPARLFLLLQTGQAAPSDQRYVQACGPVTIEKAEGEKPMSIEWKLEVPLPIRLYQEFNILRGQ